MRKLAMVVVLAVACVGCATQDTLQALMKMQESVSLLMEAAKAEKAAVVVAATSGSAQEIARLREVADRAIIRAWEASDAAKVALAQAAETERARAEGVKAAFSTVKEGVATGQPLVATEGLIALAVALLGGGLYSGRQRQRLADAEERKAVALERANGGQT